MDIGRLIERIEGNQYSLQLLFKEKESIKHETEKEIGKKYITNIDDKGRIYLPREIPDAENDPFAHLPLEYSIGLLSLSAFGCIKLHIAWKSIRAIRDKISKSADSNASIRIVPTQERAMPNSLFLDNYHAITTRPFLFKPNFDYLTRHKKRNKPRTTIKHAGDSIRDQLNYYTRIRLKLPKVGLSFNELDLDKDKIVLFKLRDELEIWKKERWDRFENRILWLSQDSKILFIDEGTDEA